MTRYALYFAPEPDSSWWKAGCDWLGCDPDKGTQFAQYTIPTIPRPLFAKLTSGPRRYGFHATLKAPFTLADGFSESHLLTMAEAFSQLQRPVVLEDMQVRPIGNFLALCPGGPLAEINALAMRCIAYFDMLRAVPTEVELARRRLAKLSVRQEALMQRWGYPYTEEEFRLHMTLTDSLNGVDTEAVYAIRKAAEQCFDAARAVPPVISALTIFREDEPGAPLSIWRRFPFNASQHIPALPTPGRLFYVVGPSGVGKDSLLQWLQQHVSDNTDVVFAQRTITRPPHPSESHEAIEVTEFWQQAASGYFSMTWQANDLCYGIRRGIEADLKAGKDVVINGSREYVPQLQQAFPDAKIVWIEAASSAIEERLQSRQRETGAALLKRIARTTQFTPPVTDVIRLDNTGPLDVAGKQLLEIISASLAAKCRD